MNHREKAGQKKAKKGGRARRGSDEDGGAHMSDDEVSIVAPQFVSTKDADGNELTAEDLQDQLVEQLAEKRASTRQGALARLIDQLQLGFEFDFLTERLETLQLYLLNSVRKGDSSEVVLACRALQLVSATLGAESEKLLEAAQPVLHAFLKNTSKGPSGRAATAEALGFLAFIGGIGDKDSLHAMALLLDALQSSGSSVPEAVSVAVWEAWGLLASSLVPSRLAGEVALAHMPALTRFLDDESTDVKTAAGENIALIIEAKQTVQAEREGEEGGEEDSAEEDAGAGAVSSSAAASAASADPATDLSTLIAKLSALATEGSRHRARKERAVQRKSFRDILRTVEDGELPSESLKIEKSRHEFEGWAHVKQLAAFREVLGKGLNVHFVHNGTVRDVFDLYIESGEGVDDPHRKAASRAQSHAKSLENFKSREKGRKKKAALANALGDE